MKANKCYCMPVGKCVVSDRRSAVLDFIPAMRDEALRRAQGKALCPTQSSSSKTSSSELMNIKMIYLEWYFIPPSFFIESFKRTLQILLPSEFHAAACGGVFCFQ